METLLHDARYAIRTMLKSPGFTAVAVIALALGIGANTAIFSVVNAVLLRPLPYKEPERLVHVHRMQPPIQHAPISRPDYFEWENQQQVFQGIAAFFYRTYNLTGVDEAEKLAGARVTGSFFALFGVAPVAGRFFDESDDQPGASRIAVISYGLWQRRLGGSSDVIGSTINLNGDSYAVVGVAPSFQFPRSVDIWTPADLAEEKTQRGSNYLKVIARLKDGVSRTQAQAQMNQIAAALAEKYPANDTSLTVAIVPMLENQVGEIRPVLWIMLGAVAFVLMIACANVANLLLARATARQKEFAIRSALGAGRWRIARQLLTESVLLALAGGAIGTLLSVWGIRVLVAAAPANIPRVKEISLDGWVLAFTLLISIATGIIFGLAPSFQLSTTELNETLKEGGRGNAGMNPHRALLRRALVIAEIALSLVLLVSAGLLIESINHLAQVSPGFDPRGVLAADVSFPRQPSTQKEDDQTPARFLSAVEQRIAALPGVVAVGTINDLPVTGWSTINGDFNVEGRPRYNPGEEPVAEFRLVTPNYFRAIGIPVLNGRELTEHDDQNAPKTIMINQAIADRIFPDENPIGKRLIALDDKPHEIVGIVGNARQWGLERPSDPEIYFPFTQMNFTSESTLVVRTSVDPAALIDGVRSAAREVNNDAPVFRVRPMTDVMANSTAQQRFNTVLMSVFAVVALVMAAIGLYGVIAYSVTQRTHELGIRMALGASSGDVIKLVVGQGMLLASTGVVIGLGAAFALTRLLSSLLFGVSPRDPVTFAAIALILTGVALGACFVPARRATRVDPMIALRYE